jgi:hypothetical protein
MILVTLLLEQLVVFQFQMLINDTLNGSQATLSNVTLTQISTTNNVLTLMLVMVRLMLIVVFQLVIT